MNRRAHNLKTEGHLRLRQPSPGAFEWTTRTGHTYTRHPEPLPVAGWDTTPTPRLADLPPDPDAKDFAQMLAYLDAA